jgi:uncharacterized protein Yka (UPF0111/DUF47 family)
MPEDMIRYDDVMNQSIAEMNLAEQLVGIIDVIVKESARAYEMACSLKEGKKELVKKGYDYVRQLKDEAQDRKEATMEYIVRVTPSLITKEIYMFSLSNLDKLSQIIDSISYRLTIIAHSNVTLDQEILENIVSMFSKIRVMIDDLFKAAKNLNINTKITLELHDRICSKENEIDEDYRKLELNVIKKFSEDIYTLMIVKEIVDLMEDTADLVRDASHDFKYIALYRS